MYRLPSKFLPSATRKWSLVSSFLTVEAMYATGQDPKVPDKN